MIFVFTIGFTIDHLISASYQQRDEVQEYNTIWPIQKTLVGKLEKKQRNDSSAVDATDW